jgi:hypothetical protein
MQILSTTLIDPLCAAVNRDRRASHTGAGGDR